MRSTYSKFPVRIFFSASLITSLVASLSLTMLSSCPFAQAGPNDFFGGQVPGTVTDPEDDKDAKAAAQGQKIPPGAGDFTDDEKRMQKKYKENLAHAQKLIGDGDRMMKDGQNRNDAKLAKKGKVLKDIGQKTFDDLKANSPFPAPEKGKTAGKKKTDEM